MNVHQSACWHVHQWPWNSRLLLLGMWSSVVAQIVQFTLRVYLSHHFCGYWVHHCDTQWWMLKFIHLDFYVGRGGGGHTKIWCTGKFGKMMPMLCCIFDTAAHVRDIPNKFVQAILLIQRHTRMFWGWLWSLKRCLYICPEGIQE
jgi:hypothetical protein